MLQRRHPDGACAGCGYALVSLPPGPEAPRVRCPECGFVGLPTRQIRNSSLYRSLAAPLACILLPYITAASLSAIDHGPLGFQPATPGLELAQAGLLLLGIPLSAAGVLLLGGMPMSDRRRAVRLLAGAAIGAFQLVATILLCVTLFEPRGS